MSKSATVRARIEPELKNEVETLFHELGLTVTEAINIFYKQVKLMHGLPFPVRIPNKATKKTFDQTAKGEDLVHCKDDEELFDKLGI